MQRLRSRNDPVILKGDEHAFEGTKHVFVELDVETLRADVAPTRGGQIRGAIPRRFQRPRRVSVDSAGLNERGQVSLRAMIRYERVGNAAGVQCGWNVELPRDRRCELVSQRDKRENPPRVAVDTDAHVHTVLLEFPVEVHMHGPPEAPRMIYGADAMDGIRKPPLSTCGEEMFQGNPDLTLRDTPLQTKTRANVSKNKVLTVSMPAVKCDGKHGVSHLRLCGLPADVSVAAGNTLVK